VCVSEIEGWERLAFSASSAKCSAVFSWLPYGPECGEQLAPR
jgi:hypothetical protein